MLGAPGGRLSVDTGGTHDPVADTNDTVVTYFPYAHNRVAVYNGTRWELKKIPDAGVILIGDTTTLAAEHELRLFPLGQRGHARGEGRPGVDVWHGARRGRRERRSSSAKTGGGRTRSRSPAAPRRTAACTSALSAPTEASTSTILPTKRHLWNAYNRVKRTMANAAETADSWAYSSATIQTGEREHGEPTELRDRTRRRRGGRARVGGRGCEANDRRLLGDRPRFDVRARRRVSLGRPRGEHGDRNGHDKGSSDGVVDRSAWASGRISSPGSSRRTRPWARTSTETARARRSRGSWGPFAREHPDRRGQPADATSAREGAEHGLARSREARERRRQDAARSGEAARSHARRRRALSEATASRAFRKTAPKRSWSTSAPTAITPSCSSSTIAATGSRVSKRERSPSTTIRVRRSS
jgi:hypothetical protein